MIFLSSTLLLLSIKENKSIYKLHILDKLCLHRFFILQERKNNALYSFFGQANHTSTIFGVYYLSTCKIVKCFSHFELFGHLIDSIKLIWPKFDRSHEFLWILLLFFLYFVIFSSSDPNWRVTWFFCQALYFFYPSRKTSLYINYTLTFHSALKKLKLNTNFGSFG
jgi:hypothetical protein